MRSLRARFGLFSCALVGGLFFSACGGDGGPGTACPAIAAANFNITVTDKATGQRICDAKVEATDSATMEKVTLDAFGSAGSCSYSGGFYDRPGSFSVTVSKAGYPSQTQTNIQVIKGVCNVTAAQVSFSL
jgi:hypothetical protein